jgi:hypothetical protein
MRFTIVAVQFLLGLPFAAGAQRVAGDSLAAIAVADSALAVISRSDFVALTNLMIDEAMTYSIRNRDARPVYSARSRSDQRIAPTGQRIDERGFQPIALVSGRLATVWMPYDLYRDGRWSHCGVDVFTMFRLEAGWKIAAMAWSVDQPPVCQRHPGGPPPAR